MSLPDSPDVRLGRSFYARTTDLVARDLLGCTLVSIENGMTLAGRIVETEAYLGMHDLASHAAMYERGRESLSRAPGSVYIYRAYGIHMMFNIVAKGVDAQHGALLIRAVEPVEGLALMAERRGRERPEDLASGPGKLCQALGFSLADHMRDLATDSTLWIEPGEAPEQVRVSPRIGITRSADLLLRFFDPASRAVSGSRRGLDWRDVAGEATDRPVR
ncbi:MAG: DNA-3-methyladenine glycosylase [Thermomicrobiales bacterium]|nr:DNA-3-methyladenine glycosylase [Thermomicrobiales bacterium]